MKTLPRPQWARTAAIALTILTGGCAAVNPASPPSSGAGPGPIVQNCGVISTGTPSRFICSGKVYTSFQLAKMREDEAKKYASGK